MLADDGTLAAGWPFTSLIEHWNRKHAQAAFVPSLKRQEPRAYRFGGRVFLGTGTDFGLFLCEPSRGAVYYDPGIKLEGVGTGREVPHRRSQFRIGFTSLWRIYRQFDQINLEGMAGST